MNTRLEIAHIGKISEDKYIAHIGIVNDEGGTPFKTITIDATNMEFARKIAEIRIEEMMSSKINGNFNEILGHKMLLMARNTYNKKLLSTRS